MSNNFSPTKTVGETMQDQDNYIPQKLYKYGDWSNEFHKKIICENEIYLSSAEQFNDPFDSSIPFRYPPEDLTEENILKKCLQVGKTSMPNKSEAEIIELAQSRIASGVFDNGEYWRSLPYVEENKKFYGVCCFTEENLSILMWSYYAKNHTGFCIGFDTEVLWDAIEGPKALGPVTYHEDESFPSIGIFDKPVSAFRKIMTTKSGVWKHENEFRLLKAKAAQTPVSLPNEAFSEIILGCKMLGNQKREIIETVKAKSPKIKILETFMDDERFKLKLRDVF